MDSLNDSAFFHVQTWHHFDCIHRAPLFRKSIFLLSHSEMIVKAKIILLLKQPEVNQHVKPN
jgi:hypothetical protein